jgi:hypothetical protein
MEVNQFDALARSLTAAGSRRQAFVALAGSLGLLSLTHLDDAVAKKKPCPPCKKRKHGKCQGKKADGAGCPGGTCHGGRCVPTCPAVCPACQTCNPATGECIPNGAAAGQPCGTCRTCNATGQCAIVADSTSCDDGNPCTINTVRTNGVCGGPSANQGKICGTSTHGGTALRCCNGACPDPNCVPSGPTGVSCGGSSDCIALNCCAQQGTTCNASAVCACFFAEATEKCASDHDCSMVAGPQKACICGTCQLPPP